MQRVPILSDVCRSPALGAALFLCAIALVAGCSGSSPSASCDPACLPGQVCDAATMQCLMLCNMSSQCPQSASSCRDGLCVTPVCGNGIVESGELCDGSCPDDCNDGNACTSDQLSGNPAACNVACANFPTVECVDGDDCCPAACDDSLDGDCSSTCGDGIIDADETCDGNCPTSCDDSDDCTTDVTTGSAANCSFACTHVGETLCSNGDGCCPAGCTLAVDDDCDSVCGNLIVEDPETCDGDCPVTCDDSDACTDDIMTGSNCTVACTYPSIVNCAGGDGCCPSGCNSTSDSDCVMTCSGSVLIPGDTTCTATRAGFEARCLQWSGTACDHPQIRPPSGEGPGACASFSGDSNDWYDVVFCPAFQPEGYSAMWFCYIGTGVINFAAVADSGAPTPGILAFTHRFSASNTCNASRTAWNSGITGVHPNSAWVQVGYCNTSNIARITCSGW